MLRDELGDRIKAFYEAPSRVLLPHKTYAIVRVDGKNFHTFTAQLPRPWSAALNQSLDAAALHVCQEMMGCRFAYGQSDEYSFLLTDLEREESRLWFNGSVQKIASVTASLFTAAFNHAWQQHRGDEISPAFAAFDARVFAIPQRTEVRKYFLWRQVDASRNSLNMLVSTYYSHDQLLGKTDADRHDLLHAQGVNWNDAPTEFKRGRLIRRIATSRTAEFTHKKTGERLTAETLDHAWQVDREIPIFTRDAAYLDALIPLPHA